MDLGLKGRTAIVCGASAGLGLASAEALAEEGANVAMLARRREQLEQQADRIGALAVRGDVTNAADLQRLVELTVQAFGGIDIVVWNSGGPPAGLAGEITDESWSWPTSSCSYPRCAWSGSACRIWTSAAGRIVCITSVAAKEPVPHLALSNTIRTCGDRLGEVAGARARPEGDHRQLRRAGPPRHAADDRALRREGPPAADLAAIPAGRLGRPRELGDLVCFLASDRGSYISGTTIPVDGGSTRGLL